MSWFSSLKACLALLERMSIKSLLGVDIAVAMSEFLEVDESRLNVNLANLFNRRSVFSLSVKQWTSLTIIEIAC